MLSYPVQAIIGFCNKDKQESGMLLAFQIILRAGANNYINCTPRKDLLLIEDYSNVELICVSLQNKPFRSEDVELSTVTNLKQIECYNHGYERASDGRLIYPNATVSLFLGEILNEIKKYYNVFTIGGYTKFQFFDKPKQKEIPIITCNECGGKKKIEMGLYSRACMQCSPPDDYVPFF